MQQTAGHEAAGRVTRYLDSLFDRVADRLADRIAARLDARIATLEVLGDAEAVEDLRLASAEADVADYEDVRREAGLA